MRVAVERRAWAGRMPRRLERVAAKHMPGHVGLVTGLPTLQHPPDPGGAGLVSEGGEVVNLHIGGYLTLEGIPMGILKTA